MEYIRYGDANSIIGNSLYDIFCMVDYYSHFLYLNTMVKICYLLAFLLLTAFCEIHPTSITASVPAGTIHLDYSPNHKYLAMISPTQLKIVISQTGAIYQTQSLSPLTLTTFAFNQDSSWLALGFKEGETHLYQNDGTKFAITDKIFKTTGNVQSICFSSDNQNVVTGYTADKIVVWQIADGTNITQDFGGQYVQSVACSPTDPKLIVVGGGLNTASKTTLYNINMADSKLDVVQDIFRDPEGVTEGVTFNGDGSNIFKTQLTGTIQVLDSKGISIENITVLQGVNLFKIRVTSNNRIIATHNQTHVLFLTLDPNNVKMLASYTISTTLKSNVQSVALSRQGQLAFYVDESGAGVGLGQCDLGTFSDGNGGCNACSTQCPICDSDPKNCYSCIPRYYLEDNKCIGCPVGCATCTDDKTCGTCDPNFELKDNLCKCKPGFFLKETTCAACGIGCDICLDQVSCITCNDKFDLDNLQCICKAGSFLDDTTCSPCIRGCTNCLDGVKCQKCSLIDHYIINQDDICLCDKVDHFIDDGTKCICQEKYYPLAEKCSACPIGCKTCTSGTSCQSCQGDLTLRDQLCKCPNTDEWFDGTFKCTACKESLDYCTQCDDPIVCKQCEAGLNRLPKNGKCECIRGFFQQSNVCVACSIFGCEDCSSADTCITCNGDQNWQLDQMTKKCSCKPYYYQNINVCIKCSLGCITCQAEKCLQCDSVNHWVDDGSEACKCMDSYYQNGQQCDICIAGCLACDNGNNCNTCDTDANFVKDQNNVCVCKDDHYFLKDRSCVSCSVLIKHCQTCELEDKCTLCVDPYINKNTACICQDGKFDDNNDCVDCPLGCSLCSSADKCSECVPGHTFYFKEDHCIACTTLPRCLTCTSQSNCLTCADPFKIIAGRCGCENGKFIDGGVCSDCPEGCTLCNSKDVCTACNEDDGYVLEDGQCKKSGINTLVIVLIVVGVIVLVGAVFVVIKCIKKRKSPLAEDDYEKL